MTAFGGKVGTAAGGGVATHKDALIFDLSPVVGADRVPGEKRYNCPSKIHAHIYMCIPSSASLATIAPEVCCCFSVPFPFPVAYRTRSFLRLPTPSLIIIIIAITTTAPVWKIALKTSAGQSFRNVKRYTSERANSSGRYKNKNKTKAASISLYSTILLRKKRVLVEVELQY